MLQLKGKTIMAFGNQGILSVTVRLEEYSGIWEPGNTECYSSDGSVFLHWGARE